MEYRITHTTAYEYDEPVAVSHHAARFQPKQNAAQSVADLELEISPRPR